MYERLRPNDQDNVAVCSRGCDTILIGCSPMQNGARPFTDANKQPLLHTVAASTAYGCSLYCIRLQVLALSEANKQLLLSGHRAKFTQEFFQY